MGSKVWLSMALSGCLTLALSFRWHNEKASWHKASWHEASWHEASWHEASWHKAGWHEASWHKAVSTQAQGGQPYGGWEFLSGTWRVRNGRIEGESGGHGFCIASASRYAKEQTLEVTLIPLKRVGAGGWASGGLCLFQDGANFWRLALVESPNAQRYTELVEMHEGVWQAQSQGKTGLRSLISEGHDLKWQFGTPYRLRLTLNRQNITGEVMDTEGNRLSRFAYAFNSALAVKAGWLAVNVAGMAAAFDDAIQQAPEEGQRKMNLRKVVLVREKRDGKADEAVANIMAEAFAKDGLEVVIATFDDVVEESWWDSLDAATLAFPNARRLPACAKEPLLAFLRGGRKLICVGAPLFAEPLFRYGDAWLTVSELTQKRSEVMPQHRFITIEAGEVLRWQRATSNPNAKSRLSSELTDKGAAFRLDIADLKGWDNFGRSFEGSPFAKGHTLTCFFARSERASCLSLEWQEKDGSRWIATMPLSTEWQHFALKPSDFAYWPDNPSKGRGGAGDRFRPENAARLVIGVAFSHGGTPGDHKVWVADLGSAQDPFGDVETDFEPPKLEALCPAYKVYPLRGIKSFGTAGSGAVLWSGVPKEKEAVAPLPRHTGIGFNGKRAYRFKPLVWAKDDGGHERGALAWTLVHAGLAYRGAAWTCIGTTDETFWRENKAALCSLLRFPTQPFAHIKLVEAGTDRFTAYEDERLTIGAKVMSMSEGEVTVGLSAILLRKGAEHSKPLSKFTRTVSFSASGATEEVLWQVPPLKPGSYTVSIMATCRKPIHPAVDDQLQHSFVVTERPKVTEADKVTVHDGHFWLNGRRWFAMGVNFWPRYACGMEPTDYWRHWLDPAFYEPIVVEQDLQLVKKMGMNCVSIQYGSPEQALPLRDFLRRCHEKGIKVNVFIPGAHPLHFEPETVKHLIESADLANQPALFAYDIAWEPRWGTYNERQRFDAQWRQWLIERYGSIEKAEAAWGFKANHDQNGNVTGPTDKQVTNDGEWRKMVADYRRFQDELLSKRYAEVRKLIKSLDANHLIGARTGWGGGPFINVATMPFDHSSGVEHLDFVSPEGWNLSGGWENFERAAFITAYARMVSGGKPVFWAEFGFNVGYPLAAVTGEGGNEERGRRHAQERLSQQAQYYENFYRMVALSNADGAMAWWFPGGYRVDERSDFGIVNPDGILRPVAEVIQRYAQKFSQLQPMPKPDTWLTVDRFKDARGAWALWQKHGEEFVRLMREGKVVGLRMAAD